MTFEHNYSTFNHNSDDNSQLKSAIPKANRKESEIKRDLIAELDVIPLNWELTLVNGEKRPYRATWQVEPISRNAIKAAINDGDSVSKNGTTYTVQPFGYGLLTGRLSSGIIAIDADGHAAHDKLKQLGGIPETVSFTSGKDGRCQYLARVPKQYWDAISTKKINTGVKGEDGKDQLLEFRWDGCQSVLPPSVHPETGAYHWVNSPQNIDIAECPEWLIELLLKEPSPKAPTIPLESAAVPLIHCLARDNRDAIKYGVGEGGRNDTGARLARDLIGAAARLPQLGYAFSGDPRGLFDEFCANCTPPIDNSECETIWKSAEKSSPSPCLDDDKIKNCVEAWMRKQSQGDRKASRTTQLPLIQKQSNDLPLDEIKAKYVKCLETQTKRSHYRFKADLKKQYPSTQHKIIDDFLKGVEDEVRGHEDDLDAREGLEKAFKQSLPDLVPHDLLPPQLASGLMLFGQNVTLPQTALIMTLISTVSALTPVGTEVLIGNKNNEFYQIPAVNHALVAVSGSGKSALTKAIITKPLKVLKKEDKARFEKEYKTYQMLVQLNEDPNNLPAPPAPKNEIFITGATMEGLKNYCSKNPDYSVLNHIDELTGLFNSFNQYKSGKGNDRQQFLSMYDGDGFNEALVSGLRSVEATNIAYIGGLQPSTLREQFDLGASDGLLPRFTFSRLPDIFRPLADEEAASVDIRNLLVGLYRNILNSPQATYHITGEAYKFFQRIDTEWQLAARRLPDGAMREFYNKCRGLLGRIALNLHLIHEVYDLQKLHEESEDPLSINAHPALVIPTMRVMQAAEIIEHLIEVLRSVHQEIDGDATQKAIMAIIELSNRRKSIGDDGWLSANEVRQTQSKKNRLTAAAIRELMDKAKNMGYGEIRGSGNRIEFKAVTGLSQTSGHVTNFVTSNSSPYTAIATEIPVTKTSGYFGSTSGSCHKTETPINNGLDPSLSQTSGSSGHFPATPLASDTLTMPIGTETTGVCQLVQTQMDVTNSLP